MWNSCVFSFQAKLHPPPPRVVNFQSNGTETAQAADALDATFARTLEEADARAAATDKTAEAARDRLQAPLRRRVSGRGKSDGPRSASV